MARRAQFEQSVGWLAGDEAAGMTHDEFEQHLDMQGRELLRRRLPDHLDLRAHQECRLAAVEASRELFDAAQDAIARGCGQALGKRQVEALAQAAAVDFDALDAHHQHPPAQATDVLVISCDGKGIVMRPDALRPATAKAAQATSSKLASRLSKGEVNVTANAWLRSEPSTTSAQSREAPMTS